MSSDKMKSLSMTLYLTNRDRPSRHIRSRSKAHSES